MSDTLHSPRHRKLIEILKRERKRAGLTQAKLAGRLVRPQSYIANIETNLRRVDVVEFLDVVAEIGADPRAIIKELLAERPTHRRPRTR